MKGEKSAFLTHCAFFGRDGTSITNKINKNNEDDDKNYDGEDNDGDDDNDNDYGGGSRVRLYGWRCQDEFDDCFTCTRIWVMLTMTIKISIFMIALIPLVVSSTLVHEMGFYSL